MTKLNASIVDDPPTAFLYHCVPCIGPCALCQEARAAAAYELANEAVPRQ